MTIKGAPKEQIFKVKKSTKIAVITANWNAEITQQMKSESIKVLEEHGLKPVSIEVSGSFELISATKNAFDKKFDAVVALGVVVKGDTPHFDYVCMGVTNGIAQIAAVTGKPIGFGVLTCDTEKQAHERAGFSDSIENKGRDSALAVLQSLMSHKKLG